MTCPWCAHPVTAEQPIAHLVFCPSCVRTLWTDGTTVRPALAADTVPLSASDRDKLLAIRRALRAA